MPRIPQNRIKERAGVNATQALFESLGYVFQAVNLENDYGKDAYVDLVNGTELTGLCVALQIKSGPSYKRAQGYAIPVDDHYQVWRTSSLPVVGIVHDPATEQLYWCDISEYLESVEGEPPSTIPVKTDRILTRETIEYEFKLAMRRAAGRRSVGLSILQLCSGSDDSRFSALSDCFALARSDPRVLIVLRYLLRVLRDDLLRYALHILAHATPHPDIFWTKDNWIPESFRQILRPHIDWSQDELQLFFTTVKQEEWERGGSGQDLYMMLKEDRKILKKLEIYSAAAIEAGEYEAAYSAFYLLLHWSGKRAVRVFNKFTHDHPKMFEIDLISEVGLYLCDYGEVAMF